MEVKQKPLQEKRQEGKPRVLVLCHGNICRSPLVEAILRLRGVEVKSAGLSLNSVGEHPAAKKVRDWAAARGIDLARHRSRMVTTELLQWATQVVYMDQGNKSRLDDWEPIEATVSCLGNEIWESRIADPNYMAKGSVEFSETLEKVVRASENLAHRLNKKP